jgi:alpha-ribazole phosphatase
LNIFLVRHTTPAVQPGICYGQADIDVAASFTEELQNICSKLPQLTPDAIYSSPLQRCLKLAYALAGESEVIEDARLMELDFGDWELKPWDDIPRGLVDVWADDHVMQPPPNGESFHALSLRAADFFREVSANHVGQELLVMTHAGVIRALLSQALNLHLTDTFRLQIDYGSITQISIDKAVTRVAYVNR